MGTFDIDMSGIMKQLESLGNIDTVAPQMVDAGLDILEKGVKKGYSQHKNSGSLENSIKVKKAKKTGNGYYGYIAPDGNDERGVSNGEKAVYLEHGTWKQTATPVIAPAVAEYENKVVAAMEQKYKELMG